MKEYRPWSRSVGAGWQEHLVDPFLEVADRCPDIHIGQVKEKFGRLCLYVSAPEWAMNLAQALEEVSKLYCEDCGRVQGWRKALDDDYAKVTTAPVRGWYRTLCQYCRAEEERSRSLEEQAQASEA